MVNYQMIVTPKKKIKQSNNSINFFQGDNSINLLWQFCKIFEMLHLFSFQSYTSSTLCDKNIFQKNIIRINIKEFDFVFWVHDTNARMSFFISSGVSFPKESK